MLLPVIPLSLLHRNWNKDQKSSESTFEHSLIRLFVAVATLELDNGNADWRQAAPADMGET